MSNTAWTTSIQEDPNNPDECVIVFPDDMMTELSWTEGDTIVWRISEDGSVTLSRKE